MPSGVPSSYPGAAQPGATSTRESVVTVTVGSFNFGVNQKMLQRDPWAREHRDNFRRVCVKMVKQEKLDIMFGCELGQEEDRGGSRRIVAGVSEQTLVSSAPDMTCG